jgi:hypothetical protein
VVHSDPARRCGRPEQPWPHRSGRVARGPGACGECVPMRSCTHAGLLMGGVRRRRDVKPCGGQGMDPCRGRARGRWGRSRPRGRSLLRVVARVLLRVDIGQLAVDPVGHRLA